MSVSLRVGSKFIFQFAEYLFRRHLRAEKPEVFTVGAVFPGLPGYRPSMKGRLPNSGDRDASACAEKRPLREATEQILHRIEKYHNLSIVTCQL